MRKRWRIPTVGAESVCRMEDVLRVCATSYDPRRPQVCFDEKSVRLIARTRQPLPSRPGQPQRSDYEYQREGTANPFVFFQPLAGWRHIVLTDQRTKVDFTECMRYPVDEVFPEAERILAVLDNLNAHAPDSLSEAFELAQARRILDRFEFHWTPKHGSWLNMVEIEIGVLCEQYLDGPIPDRDMLESELAGWERSRQSVGANRQLAILSSRRSYETQATLSKQIIAALVRYKAQLSKCLGHGHKTLQV